jgi:hypothetical protein
MVCHGLWVSPHCTGRGGRVFWRNVAQDCSHRRQRVSSIIYMKQTTPLRKGDGARLRWQLLWYRDHMNHH